MKVFVDTAAVMEKPLAAAAGLGWQGKHTNLVSREFGSWLFLGAIFTTLELPPDQIIGEHVTAITPGNKIEAVARHRVQRRMDRFAPDHGDRRRRQAGNHIGVVRGRLP